MLSENEVLLGATCSTRKRCESNNVGELYAKCTSPWLSPTCIREAARLIYHIDRYFMCMTTTVHGFYPMTWKLEIRSGSVHFNLRVPYVGGT